MEKSWNQILVEAINTKDKPLKRKDIKGYITKDLGLRISDSLIGVLLNLAVKGQILCTIKLGSLPMYYCNPEWVDEGKLKPGYFFDPIWGTGEFQKPITAEV